MAKIKTGSSSNSKSPKKLDLDLPQWTATGWVILVLAAFPVFWRNYYFDIIESKTRFYYVISIALACFILLWALISGVPGDYFREAKLKYADANGKWFKKWFFSVFNALDICVMIFIAANIFATLAAGKYFIPALTGNEGRFSGLLMNLVYVGTYFIMSRCYVFNKRDFIIFLAVGWFPCLMSLFQHLGFDVLSFRALLSPSDKKRFISTMGNLNVYAVYTGMITAVSACLFMLSEDKWYIKLFYYVSLLMGFIGMTVGTSDSVYLELAVLFGVVPFIAFRKTAGIRRYVACLAGLFTSTALVGYLDTIPVEVLGVNETLRMNIDGLYASLIHSGIAVPAAIALWAIVIVLYILARNETKGKLAGKWVMIVWSVIFGLTVASVIALVAIVNSGSQLSVTLLEKVPAIKGYLYFDDMWGTKRGYIWRVALEEYAGLPWYNKIFGTGPDTFGIYMMNNRFEEMLTITGQYYDSAHNEFLQFLMTIGPAGALSYIGMYVSTIWDMFKNKLSSVSPELTAAAMAVLCYGAQGMVSIYQPIVSPLFWVMLVIVRSLTKRLKAEG